MTELEKQFWTNLKGQLTEAYPHAGMCTMVEPRSSDFDSGKPSFSGVASFLYLMDKTLMYTFTCHCSELQQEQLSFKPDILFNTRFYISTFHIHGDHLDITLSLLS